MTSLTFLVFFAVTSSVNALTVHDVPVNGELKASGRESELSEDYSDHHEAELDQLERQFESEMLQSFQPSAGLVSAWTAELKGKAKSKLQASQICLDDIMNKVMDHPECADPWDKQPVCEHAYEVPSYRLGDSFFEDHSAIPEFTKFYFPKSIAAKYLQAKSGKYDVPTMLNIINSTDYANYETPSENVAVVHLRLGDALLKDKEYMLRDDSYYARHAEIMKKNNISSVVLVTGDHKVMQRATLTGTKQFTSASDNAQKMTMARMKEVEQIFKKHHMTVSTRINYNADCDFVYMSNAHTFLQAGGTFSRLIARLVKQKGGHVMGYNKESQGGHATR